MNIVIMILQIYAVLKQYLKKFNFITWVAYTTYSKLQVKSLSDKIITMMPKNDFLCLR